MDEICQLAHERGVHLLIDGERDTLQAGIDAWTIQFASKYNTTPGKATVFGTYQAYKKSMREALSRHLAEAQKGSFTLGVKRSFAAPISDLTYGTSFVAARLIQMPATTIAQPSS